MDDPQGLESSSNCLGLSDFETHMMESTGASWTQFNEPTLVKDLESHQLEAFTQAYADLESSLSGVHTRIGTYLADVTVAAYTTLTSHDGVSGLGFDLVHGSQTSGLIKGGFLSGKYFLLGVVDGRNIWVNDLAASISKLHDLEGIVGKDKLVVSTSSSLFHTDVDLVNETKLDEKINSWLAIAAQKILEVNALAKASTGQKDEVFFTANDAVQVSRISSPRVKHEAEQKEAVALEDSEHRRATKVTTTQRTFDGPSTKNFVKLVSLIQWEGMPPEDATWEDFAAIIKEYSHLHLEDKVIFEDGGNDTSSGPRGDQQQLPTGKTQPNLRAQHQPKTQ